MYLIKKFRMQNQRSPLHFIAEDGDFELYKYVEKKFIDKNPKCSVGITPLFLATQFKHTEISELILGRLQNKNPTTQNGVTPLHNAASNGDLKIFRLIFDSIKARYNQMD